MVIHIRSKLLRLFVYIV